MSAVEHGGSILQPCDAVSLLLESADLVQLLFGRVRSRLARMSPKKEEADQRKQTAKNCSCGTHNGVSFRRLTFELSGGEAVRLNEGLGVTDGGKAKCGLNATGPAAARHGAAKSAPNFAERQRPLTD